MQLKSAMTSRQAQKPCPYQVQKLGDFSPLNSKPRKLERVRFFLEKKGLINARGSSNIGLMLGLTQIVFPSFFPCYPAIEYDESLDLKNFNLLFSGQYHPFLCIFYTVISCDVKQ